MRAVSLLIVVMCLIGGTSGCRTCDDRPRLLDRLFHKDRDDCPSRSSRDAVRPCDDFAGRGVEPMRASLVPGGYGQLHTTPVSSSVPIYSVAPFTGYPLASAPRPVPAARDDELPMPGAQRLGPTSVPTGVLSPPLPAAPSVAGNPDRLAGEPRK